MKILFVLDDYRRADLFGGGDIIAQSMYHGLKARGHKIEIACNWHKNNDPINSYGMHRICVPKKIWKKKPLPLLGIYLLKDRYNLFKVLSKFKPDIIYCFHQRGIAIPTIAWINNIDFPKVYRVGDEWIRLHYYANKCKWINFWERKELSFPKNFIKKWSRTFINYFITCNQPKLNLKFVIFNSQDLMNRHKQFLDSASKYTIIQNGVNASLFRACEHRLSSELRIIFVGRIVSHKGLHILISSLKILRTEMGIKNAQLTIIGSSSDIEYKEKLNYQTKEQNVENAIHWIGSVPHEDIPKYLNNHDIFVFPSIQRDINKTIEGCPSVILEALASGLPVVARISSGVGEIIKDGETGIGVHNDDPKALAQGIMHLVKNPSLYKHLSEIGPIVISQKYELEDMINKTEIFLNYCVRNWKT